MNNTLSGKLTSRGNLNGNVNTIVFAHNYNDLTNKPQINNVTLQGNKTASELGLATPSDITVTSVNEQTGDVVLSGSDINYSVGMSLNAKIDDLESQIHDSGVETVNGMTGNVILTGNNINYSTGVTIKDKIDTVEGEIPTTYVSSVNGNSGAVTLTGSNLEYSSGLSINDKIDAVEGEIPVVDYPVTSVNEQTGDVELTGADIPLGTDFSDPNSTAGAIKAVENKIEYQAGDVIDISNIWCTGYQGNSTTRIFFIPLSKPLASGVNVALTANVSAYSLSGSTEPWSNVALSSLGTITLTKTVSGILVSVAMTTAVSTTGYTPLTMRIISGTITLS